MKIVIFGLSVSSSWGNGHASLWRGLIQELVQQRHLVTFFEKDVPYYANNRDLIELPPGGRLVLYKDWLAVLPQMRREVEEADVCIVTSYCPDALDATKLVLDSRVSLRCFYDLDTPVTLSRLDAGETVDYIGPGMLSGFDLTLSYTGGAALEALRTKLGARRTHPIYGSVHPDFHKAADPNPSYRALLSYLGTYAPDRQEALDRLFLRPAKAMPGERFVIAGAQYPETFPWSDNIFFVRHLPPPEHPAFYSSSRMTLNVTRAAMQRMGWCPSGRLFEAAACGAPILSDWFEGLPEFFQPGEEIIVADTTEETLEALRMDDADLQFIARRARERTLDQHTANRRAKEMISVFEDTMAAVA